MTILVTGGAGYIGTHTCVELLNAGYDVVVVDNFENSRPEAVRRVNEITGRRVKLYEMDIRDGDSLTKLFEENDIRAVVHFAGLKAVSESISKPISYYQVNVAGTLSLIEAMERHNVRKLVFSSTANVYGVPKTVPVKEDAPRSVQNPYGRTKLMIEEILGDLHRSDHRWHIALLRYFNPIGAHESGSIGEAPSGIPSNLMPYITQVASGLQEKLQIFGDDYDTADGTGVRDYIHVVDLARGHLNALEYVMDNGGVESFNLGTGRGYSVREVIEAFVRVTGESVPFEVVSRRTGDIPSSYADVEKARRVLGWKAEKTLDDMCRDAWKWQRNNPSGYISQIEVR